LPPVDVFKIQTIETPSQIEQFDKALQQIAYVIQNAFFNGTGIKPVWEQDYVINDNGTWELSAERMPRFRYNDTDHLEHVLQEELATPLDTDQGTHEKSEKEHTQALMEDKLPKIFEELGLVRSDDSPVVSNKHGKFFYPSDYLNICSLGFGEHSTPIMWRMFDMFPQLSFWIFEKNVNEETVRQVAAQFPHRKIFFAEDEDIERLRPRCHLAFFSVDSVEFSMWKLQKLFTKTTEMLLIFVTTGCTPGFKNFAELTGEPENTNSRQCRFLAQLWSSTLCNKPEDMSLTYSQINQLKEAKYGLVGECYSGGRKIVSVDEELANAPHTFHPEKIVGINPDTGNTLVQKNGMIFDDSPLVIESAACMCFMDHAWITDLFYEKPICEEFENITLPPGKRIYARHTENWYSLSASTSGRVEKYFVEQKNIHSP